MPNTSIISSLPKMSRSELVQVQQLTAILLSGSEPTNMLADAEEFLLFEALKSEFIAQGFNGRIPYDTLRSSKYYKTWQQGSKTIDDFIDKYFKKHIKTDIERSALLRTLIQCLMADLKRMKVPVSLGTIARNLHRTPQAFENSFPGYLRSGLAYLIVRALIKTKNA